ncbi:unnamed protein product [Cylicostephanus goldi]|uniref:Uncharacterized protein n=1 Tax=Cylicostephanus goldi TaxID=71465 RepID=A0A3P7QAC9_CYLGO|nr:unnamed protein product [Cylicostephanus goldi]
MVHLDVMERIVLALQELAPHLAALDLVVAVASLVLEEAITGLRSLLCSKVLLEVATSRGIKTMLSRSALVYYNFCRSSIKFWIV